VYVLYTARRLTYSAFQRCIEHTQSNEEKHLKTSLRCLSGTFQYTVPTSGTERFLTRKNRSPAPPNVQSPGSKFCTEIRGGCRKVVICCFSHFGRKWLQPQWIPRRRKHKKQYYNYTCYVDYN